MSNPRFTYQFHRLSRLAQKALPTLVLLLMAAHLASGGVRSAALEIQAIKSDTLLVDTNNNSQANAGDSLRYSVVITNNLTTDAASATFSDTIDPNTTLVPGSVKTTPLARNDGPYSTVGNVLLSVNAAAGVLANDNDPDGSGPVTISVYPTTSANGGSVTLSADGSFTYNPAPGFSGTDTFAYSVQDTDGGVDPATVSITVGQVVWFINNSLAGPGDGRFTSPFSSIANFNSLAVDDPTDYIFIYQGSGSYTGALTLLNGQQLIGHGVGLVLSPNLSIAAGTRPVLANTGSQIILGQNNTVRGLTVSNSIGVGISGSGFGTLTINNISVSTSSGSALNLSSGVLNATFDSVSSSSAANGIVLTNTTGSFSVTGSGTAGSGGVIQNMSGTDPAGIGVRLSNSSGALSFSFNHVNISGVTADAVRLALLNTATATFSFNNLRVLGPTGNDGVDLALEDSAVGNITVLNSTFQNSGFGFGGVVLQATDNASGAWQVVNNSMTNNGGTAIIAASFLSAGPTAVIADNVINCPGGDGTIPGNTNGAAPCQVGEGIRVIQDGNGALRAWLDNNSTSRAAVGILARARNGSGRLDLRLGQNSNTNPTAPFFQEGVFIEAGTSSGTHTNTLCLNTGTGNTPAAGSNSSTGSLGADGYYLRERTGTTVLVQGIANGSTAAQVDAFIEANNTGSAFVSASSGPYDGGTCNTPVQTALLETGQSLALLDSAAPASLASRFDAAAAAASAQQLLGQAGQMLADLAREFQVSPAYASGETISITLGTLNTGQSVVITFDAVIADPLPANLAQVCNQGTVTAAGGLTILTDDLDVAGSTDSTCTFLADETPPDTSITASPSDPSSDTSPSFTFAGTDDVTSPGSLTFQCDLDGSGFSACSSPHILAGLADGQHTFQVRAVDLAGNVDPSPASYTWVVDAVNPSVTLDQAAGQADPTADSPIHFTAIFSEPVTGFIDASVMITGTAGATTAVVTEITPQDGTTYDVAVSGMTTNGTVAVYLSSGAAVDAAGNGSTPSSSTDNVVTFFTDQDPPETSIDSSPANPTSSTSAEFTFSGSDNITPAQDLTFECELDSSGFSACTSPQIFSGLAPGNHTFAVRAIDGAGNVDPSPALFTWDIRAATTLLYNGAQIVDVGKSFQPAAKLSSALAACQSGQTISFSLNTNPITGAVGAYPLGSAVTNASGQATLGAVNTTGWLEGIYTLTSTFAGTANCDPSSDQAILTVASPGNSATGGGWYTLPGSGRINFGFNVRKEDNRCKTNCAYKGNLLFMNNGKWRLQGKLNAYSQLANGQGAVSGLGSLYWWDASLNNGLGDWVLAQADVSFTANFFDSGGKGKSSTDAFGINIQYTPVSPPQPGSLPNSAPSPLKGGDIKVQ